MTLLTAGGHAMDEKREPWNNEPIKDRIVQILLNYYGAAGPDKEGVAFEILAELSDPTQAMVEAGASFIEENDYAPNIWELWEEMIDTGLGESGDFCDVPEEK